MAHVGPNRCHNQKSLTLDGDASNSLHIHHRADRSCLTWAGLQAPYTAHAAGLSAAAASAGSSAAGRPSDTAAPPETEGAAARVM